MLQAAADLIAASPGEDIPLRAICERAGVKMPTLYHFFGSKKGLLDAVVQHGFDRYVARKDEHESTGDPIQDIREGWNAHVAFGLAHPGFYALMYGQTSPGQRPAPAAVPAGLLLGLTTAAAEQGRLVVSARLAADHVLAANIGTTLALITSPDADPALSDSMREATIAAITGSAPPPAATPASDAVRLLQHSADIERRLGAAESALLRKWLVHLARPAAP